MKDHIDNKKKYLIFLGYGAVILLCGIYVMIIPRQLTIKGAIYFSSIIVLFFLLMLYILHKLYYGLKWNYTKLFLITSIVWIAIMQLVLPPLSGTDEVAHYYNAYNFSNALLGITDDDGQRGIMMRKGDADIWTSMDVSSDGTGFSSNYHSIINNFFDRFYGEEEELVYVEGGEVVKLEEHRYVFAGLGIAIARLMHLGFIPTMMLGRICNSVFFVVGGLFAIRIIPKGKAQIIALITSPMLIQEITTYSYDTLSITTSILCVAIFLWMRENYKEIKIIHVICLILTYLVLASNKGIYFAWILLVFTIPWNKIFTDFIDRHNKKVTGVIITSIGIIAIIFLYIFIKYGFGYYFSRFMNSDNIMMGANGSKWSLGYIIANPGNAVRLILDWLKRPYGNILAAMGTNIGCWRLQLDDVIPRVLIQAVFWCNILHLTICKGKRNNKKTLIIWMIIVAVSIMATLIGCMVLFTPVESTYIWTAGRYFSPIIYCSFIILGSDGDENNMTLGVYAVQNIIMMSIAICVLNYCLKL